MSRLEREALLQVKELKSHAFCPDGTSSAMVCTAAFAKAGISPDVKFIQYDTADHRASAPTPGQLWVDITPPVSRWEEWRGSGAIVLDHHETAKAAVEGLSGVYGGLNDSGASLAFKNVMRVLCPDHDDIEKWAKFSYLCMLRDTWKDADPDWEDACAVANALSFYTERALLVSAESGNLDLDEILRFGKVLMKKTTSKAYRHGQTASFYEAGGLKYGISNVSEKIVSETGHELLEKHGCDVAIMFYFAKEETLDVCVSLRSKKGGVPVNKIAEHYGGGGHQPAAGFRIRGAEEVSFKGIAMKVIEAAEAVLAKA